MYNIKNIVEIILDKFLVLLSVCVALCCTYLTGGKDEANCYTSKKGMKSDSREAFGSFIYVLNGTYKCKLSNNGNNAGVATSRHLFDL